MSGTGAGRKYYISEEYVDQNTDLDQAGFEALTWVEIGNVAPLGDGGVTATMPTRDETGNPVAIKRKGVTTPQDQTIELRPVAGDLGQTRIAAVALTRKAVGFKVEEDDAQSASYSNSMHYNRCVVAGPTEGFGGSDDFRTKVYTLGLQQLPVEVASAAISS